MVNFHFPQMEKAKGRSELLESSQNSSVTSIDVEVHAIPIVLGLCFLFGIAGNGALLYTICKSKKFRNVPNMFLMNIAVTNMVMLLICSPLVATSSALEKAWPFGLVACKLIHSIPQAAIAISMFSLIGLSIERYGAFAAPPKHRVSAQNRGCVGILSIWILGSLCGLPLAIFAYEKITYETKPDGSSTKLIECEAFNEELWQPLYMKIHTIVSISFLFLIPLILCIIFYLSLSCVVCAKKQVEGRYDDDAPLKNGGRSSRSGTMTKTTSTNTKTIDSKMGLQTLKRITRKRRTMAKVVLILIIQFTVFWAPKWASLLRSSFVSKDVDFIWYLTELAGLVAVFFNAALTPYTAVICSRGFRHQLGKYLCCCCSCFSCCQCQSRSDKDDSADKSTDESSQSIEKYKKGSKKSGCCTCCVKPAVSDDESTATDDSDKPDGQLDGINDQSNLYQELPDGNFYDSFTLPIKPQINAVTNDIYAVPTVLTLPASNNFYSQPQAVVDPSLRGTYVVNHDIPYSAASYHGDDIYYDRNMYTHATANGMPQLVSYRHLPNGVGRFPSEPVLHAQAPKYSQIYIPQREPQVEEVTRIKELSAM